MQFSMLLLNSKRGRWTADYGDPDDPEAFDYILPYSPLHNVHRGVKYPPMMLLTGGSFSLLNRPVRRIDLQAFQTTMIGLCHCIHLSLQLRFSTF